MASSSSWLQLSRRTAIVTGAASGLGAAVARSLVHEHGCQVVLADADEGRLHGVAGELAGEATTGILPVPCDVTDYGSVASLVRAADEFAETAGDHETSPHLRRATLLVNCAGITRDNWVGKMSLDEWDDVLDVNLKGSFLTCRAFLDHDRLQEDADQSSVLPGGESSAFGAIVNVGSVVSEFGNLGQVNYAASKGGVVGMTRALAKESASRGVRVNAVLPGFCETPMAAKVPEAVLDRLRPRIALGRFGRPSEVADLVSFLLSPRSSYITGETVTISGMIAL